jgi:UDPglucose--hexose-1-phosphate uridylyltransferase
MGEEHRGWQFQAHFNLPLLRSETMRKFMVGFELLGGPGRDIMPKSAAEMLRQAGVRIPGRDSKVRLQKFEK